MMLSPVLAAILSAGVASGPAASADCDAAATMEFRCGLSGPEDMVPLAGGDWLLASSLDRSAGYGTLRLIETGGSRGRVIPVAFLVGNPDPHYPCASALKADQLLPHGLSVATDASGRSRLFVVNHGGRETVEVFDVEMSPAVPQLTWRSCVPAPEGTYLNAVAGLADGGFLATSQFNAEDQTWDSRRLRSVRGEPSGGLFEWHPGRAFRRLPMPPVSGPNGLALSHDQRYAYVTGWSGRSVHRIDLTGGEAPTRIDVDFLPDNLRWSPDGSLLVAGQVGTVAHAFACHLAASRPKYCEPRWAALALDRSTLEIRRSWRGDASAAGFGDISTIVESSGRLWLGSISGDRVAVLRGDSPNTSVR